MFPDVSWTRPKGGYFISLEVGKGCAARVVTLAKEAGVVLTPAGATHPYGKDPDDRTIRIAPTFPELAEVAQAAEGVALCVLLAAAEKAVRGVHQLPQRTGATYRCVTETWIHSATRVQSGNERRGIEGGSHISR